MTFTEAAVEVLRREGKPLHFKKIAEIAIRESLLDHVGKIPEEVMGGQLADHCRLPHLERRVVAVQPGTFALVEWGLDEDPHGLENLIEPPPENEPAYRPQERHPIPSREMARSSGRGAEQRARRREEGEERHGKRFPPPADVAFEILAGSDRPLTFAEIAARGAERLLMPDAFVRDASALAAALAEDNKRREGSGRKPLFGVDGEVVTLVAQPEPGERAAAPARVAAPAAAPGDARRAGLAALRRRLRECDAPTVEHVAARLLEQLGFRDVKVAKRGREHVVYTARRKMGLADVRHAVRILRAGGEVTRRDVTDLRRDLSNYGAQIGMVVSAGDSAREARGDASAPGQLPVLLLCGDALAEAMAEAALGCRLVLVPEVDDAFFRAAAEAAGQEESARKARREERDQREGREGRDQRDGRREERGEREGRPERGERREGERRERPERAERREAAERPEGEGGKPAGGPVELELEPGASAGAGEKTVVVVESELADESRERAVEVAAAGAAEVATADAEGDDGEDDDDEGDEAEPGKEAAEAGGEKPAAEGEPRRRRRRRRRRGGRGRGERREQAAGAAGAPAGPGAAQAEAVVPAGGDSAAGASSPPTAGGGQESAPPPSIALPPPLPAPERGHEPPKGGGEEPS